MTGAPARIATRPATGSQERAQHTRARVVAEMVACVLEEGYAAASARRVAERAGVTWGVVQYHFGDRDGILAAVIEQGYAELARALGEIPEAEPDEPDPRAHMERVVAAAWAAFSTDLSRAAFEVLVATRTGRDPRIEQRLRALGKAVRALGKRVTGDALLGEVMWAALRGMVLTTMMTGAPSATGSELAALADLLTATRLRQLPPQRKEPAA